MSCVGARVESPSLYPHLTGRENLEVTRRLLGSPRELIDRALATIKLTRDADRRVREYSLGMRQRLGLGPSTAPRYGFAAGCEAGLRPATGF